LCILPLGMKKLFIAALSLAAVSCFAAPGDSAWALRLGAVFPRVSNGLSADTGGAFSVSYRVTKASDPYSIEIESLGAAFKISDGVDSADISTSNFNVIGLYPIQGSAAYVGGSIGFGRGSASSGGVSITGDTKAVYGLVGGYKFNKQWFGEARYVFSDVPALRGTFIMAGFRF